MLSDTVAEQIAAWRKERGWNRERLAYECAKLGMPELTHAAITNIETGRRNKEGERRRSVTVDELAVFALALNISPALLFSPWPSDQKVNLGGEHDYPSYCVTSWLLGDAIPRFDLTLDENREKVTQWYESCMPLIELREHMQMMETRKLFSEMLVEEAERTENAPETEDPKSGVSMRLMEYAQNIQDADFAIVNIRQQMDKSGHQKPVLPSGLEYLENKNLEDFDQMPVAGQARRRRDAVALIIDREKEWMQLRRHVRDDN